jgi:hypothetical protein
MIYGRSFQALWAACLAITVAAFAVQIVPILGLISHFLLTPWWPTLFLNAAFVLMAVDALIGSKNRKLLILPMVWFGGYALVAGVSYVEVYLMNRAAEKMNAQQLPTWYKATNNLRVINGPTDSNFASDLRSEAMIRLYDIDEVYSDGSRSTRLSRESCPGTMGADIIDGVSYTRIWRGTYPSKGPMQSANGICMVSGPRTPPSNIISVTAREISYREGLVAGLIQDFDVAVPNREPFTLRSVTVSPLPWIPMPVAGCHFKGGFGDQWDNDCHAYFEHPSWRRNTDTTPLKVVARALGLKSATIEERMPNLTWTPVGRH